MRSSRPAGFTHLRPSFYADGRYNCATQRDTACQHHRRRAPSQLRPRARNAATIELSFPQPDIALLTFDVPGKGANILSAPCSRSWPRIWTRLAGRKDLAGLVIRSGKPGIVHRRGRPARVRRLARHARSEDGRHVPPRAQAVSAAVEHRPSSPSRRSTASASAAGPSWPSGATGGSCPTIPKTAVRLSRGEAGPVSRLGRHGPRAADRRAWRNAVEMITGGESIDARAALRDGPGQRRRAGRQAARAPRSAWSAPSSKSEQYLERPRALERPDRRSARPSSASSARRPRPYIQQQTKGNYPAPLAALEVMLGRVRGSTPTRPARWKPRGWRSCSARRSTRR